MNSRLLFRENGQVIRTRSLARELLTVAVAVVSAVLLLAWGHTVDQDADEGHAFEAGLTVGRQEMAEAVGDAYRRGHLDAMSQHCHAPQGPAAQLQRGPL